VSNEWPCHLQIEGEYNVTQWPHVVCKSYCLCSSVRLFVSQAELLNMQAVDEALQNFCEKLTSVCLSNRLDSGVESLVGERQCRR